MDKNSNNAQTDEDIEDDKLVYNANEEDDDDDLLPEKEPETRQGLIEHTVDGEKEKPESTPAPPKETRFQKRIDDLTREKHESSRREEAALLYAKKVMEENRLLKDQRMTATGIGVSEAEKRLDLETADVKRKYKEAHELGDTDALVEAQENLSKLTLQKDRLAGAKLRIEQEATAEPTVEQPQRQEQQTVDPKAAAWAARNAQWFGKDKIATQVAYSLHNEIVSSGVDPRTDAYYRALDRRLGEELPHKFSVRRNESSNVTPARRSPGTSSGRKFSALTPSQKDVCKKLGITEDAYLVSLNDMQET